MPSERKPYPGMGFGTYCLLASRGWFAKRAQTKVRKKVQPLLAQGPQSKVMFYAET